MAGSMGTFGTDGWTRPILKDTMCVQKDALDQHQHQSQKHCARLLLLQEYGTPMPANPCNRSSNSLTIHRGLACICNPPTHQATHPTHPMHD